MGCVSSRLNRGEGLPLTVNSAVIATQPPQPPATHLPIPLPQATSNSWHTAGPVSQHSLTPPNAPPTPTPGSPSLLYPAGPFASPHAPPTSPGPHWRTALHGCGGQQSTPSTVPLPPPQPHHLLDKPPSPTVAIDAVGQQQLLASITAQHQQVLQVLAQGQASCINPGVFTSAIRPDQGLDCTAVLELARAVVAVHFHHLTSPPHPPGSQKQVQPRPTAVRRIHACSSVTGMPAARGHAAGSSTCVSAADRTPCDLSRSTSNSTLQYNVTPGTCCVRSSSESGSEGGVDVTGMDTGGVTASSAYAGVTASDAYASGSQTGGLVHLSQQLAVGEEGPHASSLAAVSDPGHMALRCHSDVPMRRRPCGDDAAPPASPPPQWTGDDLALAVASLSMCESGGMLGRTGVSRARGCDCYVLGSGTGGEDALGAGVSQVSPAAARLLATAHGYGAFGTHVTAELLQHPLVSLYFCGAYCLTYRSHVTTGGEEDLVRAYCSTAPLVLPATAGCDSDTPPALQHGCSACCTARWRRYCRAQQQLGRLSQALHAWRACEAASSSSTAGPASGVPRGVRAVAADAQLPLIKKLGPLSAAPKGAACGAASCSRRSSATMWRAACDIDARMWVDQEEADAAEEAESLRAKPHTMHVVGPGESMESIARVVGVSVAELEGANPDIGPEGLQAFDVIALPVPCVLPRLLAGRMGDTLASVSARNSVPLDRLAAYNADLWLPSLLSGAGASASVQGEVFEALAARKPLPPNFMRVAASWPVEIGWVLALPGLHGEAPPPRLPDVPAFCNPLPPNVVSFLAQISHQQAHAAQQQQQQQQQLAAAGGAPSRPPLTMSHSMPHGAAECYAAGSGQAQQRALTTARSANAAHLQYAPVLPPHVPHHLHQQLLLQQQQLLLQQAQLQLAYNAMAARAAAPGVMQRAALGALPEAAPPVTAGRNSASAPQMPMGLQGQLPAAAPSQHQQSQQQQQQPAASGPASAGSSSGSKSFLGRVFSGGRRSNT